MIELTVVTAVKNAVLSGNGENLKRCICSVAKLPFKHEHLIFDACSEDGTVPILDKLSSTCPKMKYVSEPDGGI